MWRNLFFVVSAGIVFTACSRRGSANGSSVDENALGTRKTVLLQPQNGSNQSGQVELEKVDGDVRVLTSVNNYNSTLQPASINNGSCASIKDPKYALTDLKIGQSDTTLQKTKMFELLNLAIIVYKSSSDKTVVSCGDIRQ